MQCYARLAQLLRHESSAPVRASKRSWMVTPPGVGRIWDLRIGRSILVLEGHVKGILAVDFSPNGYQLASGSEDHSVRIWDLRTKRSLYTIPAHQSLVSQVRAPVLARHGRPIEPGCSSCSVDDQNINRNRFARSSIIAPLCCCLASDGGCRHTKCNNFGALLCSERLMHVLCRSNLSRRTERF